MQKIKRKKENVRIKRNKIDNKNSRQNLIILEVSAYISQVQKIDQRKRGRGKRKKRKDVKRKRKEKGKEK